MANEETHPEKKAKNAKVEYKAELAFAAVEVSI